MAYICLTSTIPLWSLNLDWLLTKVNCQQSFLSKTMTRLRQQLTNHSTNLSTHLSIHHIIQKKKWRNLGEIWEKSGTAWSCSWVMGRFTFRRSSKRLKRHGFALGFPWGFPWGCSHCFHNVLRCINSVSQQNTIRNYHEKTT